MTFFSCFRAFLAGGSFLLLADVAGSEGGSLSSLPAAVSPGPSAAGLGWTPSLASSLSLSLMSRPSTDERACLISRFTSDSFVPLSLSAAVGLGTAAYVIFRATAEDAIGRLTTFMSFVESTPPLANTKVMPGMPGPSFLSARVGT